MGHNHDITHHAVKFGLSSRSFIFRGGGRTSAAGAFAPMDFQQRVHCTRSDEELPLKWPLASHRKHFLVQKMRYIFLDLGDEGTPLLPSKINAPILSSPWRHPCIFLTLNFY